MDKLGRVVSEICEQTNRQTDRHIDRNTRQDPGRGQHNNGKTTLLTLSRFITESKR